MPALLLHNPPHFHARYGEYKAVISIGEFALLEGYLPPRAFGLVMEWAEMHKDELAAAWNQAKKNRAPSPIEPLK